MKNTEIMTVGLNPVWDRTCTVDGVDWGDHKVMTSQTLVPAGKALNISKALAWMSVPSTAAGLWGSADYPQMLEALSNCDNLIQPAFTSVPGHSRQNVTVVDTRQNRELHLRSRETLITRLTLKQLETDLDKPLHSEATVVFAGSMIDAPLLYDCVKLICQVSRRCRRVVLDTSGQALAKSIEQGGIHLIKPNRQELAELLGEPVANDLEKIIPAARTLCDRVQTVLVSLGAEGAVVITKDTAVHVRAVNQKKFVISTVGCGDYLLAGYLAGSHLGLTDQLAVAVKTATAKAFGFVETRSWQQIQQEIEVEVYTYR